MAVGLEVVVLDVEAAFTGFFVVTAVVAGFDSLGTLLAEVWIGLVRGAALEENAVAVDACGFT